MRMQQTNGRSDFALVKMHAIWEVLICEDMYSFHSINREMEHQYHTYKKTSTDKKCYIFVFYLATKR